MSALAIVGIVIGSLFVLGLIGAVAGNGRTSGTATPVSAPPKAPVVATARVIPIGTARAASTAAAAAQVVTAKGEPVNVRQAANTNAPIIGLLDANTDATVLGEDTTDPDGATRWVHVRAGNKEGYVRSDLVGTPHSKTPPPTPVIQTTATRTRWSVTNTSRQSAKVRDRPSVTGTVQRTLNPGAEIESGDQRIPGFDGDGASWVAVTWGDDHSGYVRADSVTAPRSQVVSVATPDAKATATASTPDGQYQARVADLNDFVFDVACNRNHTDASIPAAWCPYAQETGIQAHGASGDEAFLTTTLAKDRASLARDACQTLWNWATNVDAATKQVMVRGSDGTIIASGIIGGKKCS